MTGKPRPPGPVSEIVGRNVREVRERKRLTQTELGEMIGGTQSMIMNLETARVQMRVEQLVEVAAALGVSTARLLRGAS